MRRRDLLIAATAAVLMFANTPALTRGAVPGGGPAFGQHVSDMAPEHPLEHGAEFGQCVSTMAQGGECPHH